MIKQSGKLSLLAIAYISFVSLGLPDAVTGVAWPFVRDSFGLQTGALGAILLLFGIGFFLSSFYSGYLVQRLGVGLLLSISSGLVCVGLVGYSRVPLWPLFILCSLMIGLGSGAIDAGLNNYASHRFSERQMNWLHACYGAGAMAGPLLFTAILSSGGSWQSAYTLLALILLPLLLLFISTRGRWRRRGDEQSPREQPSVTLLQVISHPIVRLQIALFFIYTGIEVTVGQWTFTFYTEARQITTATAGVWVGLYWGSLTLGRILFGGLVAHIRIERLIWIALSALMLGVVLYALPVPAGSSPLGLLLIGFGLAPIFPSLMSQTPTRLAAPYAVHAIGFQVSGAMIGGVLLPSLTGLLAQRFGLLLIPQLVVAFSAAFVALYVWLLRLTRGVRYPIAN